MPDNEAAELAFSKLYKYCVDIGIQENFLLNCSHISRILKLHSLPKITWHNEKNNSSSILFQKEHIDYIKAINEADIYLREFNL